MHKLRNENLKFSSPCEKTLIEKFPLGIDLKGGLFCRNEASREKGLHFRFHTLRCKIYAWPLREWKWLHFFAYNYYKILITDKIKLKIKLNMSTSTFLCQIQL